MRNKINWIILTMLAAFGSSMASAADVVYAFTDKNGASFTLVSNDYLKSDSLIDGVGCTFAGSSCDPTKISTYVFPNGAQDIHYRISPLIGEGLIIPSLFANMDGTFSINGSTADGQVAGMLVVKSSTQSALAVPEPESWAMIVIGSGVLGVAMRRRQKIVTQVSYAA